MAKAPKIATPHVNYALPQFDLPLVFPNSDLQKAISNADLIGKLCVLFLYPKDDTSGCTQEAKDFTALKSDFEALNVELYGVSKDSLKKHATFIKKYDLKTPLISDEETVLIDALGAWQEKSLYGRKYMGTDRSTFVVNCDGVIIMTWRKVKVNGHAQEVLDFVKSLNG